MNVSIILHHTNPSSMYWHYFQHCWWWWYTGWCDKVVHMDGRSVIIMGRESSFCPALYIMLACFQQIGNGSFSWQRNEFEHHWDILYVELPRTEHTWKCIMEDADLVRFIELAQTLGLYVHLRIGPYICASTTMAAFHFGSRHGQLFPVQRPRVETRNVSCAAYGCGQSAPLACREWGKYHASSWNEYNGGQQDYLEWAVDLGTIKLEVREPTGHSAMIMLPVRLPTQGHRAICTINGSRWWVQRKSFTTFTKMDGRSSCIKSEPTASVDWGSRLVWWMGCCEASEASRDQLYGIARFIAYGGSGTITTC